MTTMKTWVRVKSEWNPSQPYTLADVPEGVPCICCWERMSESSCVVFRSGKVSFYQNGDNSRTRSDLLCEKWKFVRYLDAPPPSQPTINDVPDFRVIVQDGVLFWRVGMQWHCTEDGFVAGLSPSFSKSFRITDYVMTLEVGEV